MSNHDPSSTDVQRLLQRGADLERKLYKRERRAENDLAELRAELVRDQVRLERAHARIERRIAEIAQAEATLRLRQDERATGRATGTSVHSPPTPAPKRPINASAEPSSSPPPGADNGMEPATPREVR